MKHNTKNFILLAWYSNYEWDKTETKVQWYFNSISKSLSNQLVGKQTVIYTCIYMPRLMSLPFNNKVNGLNWGESVHVGDSRSSRLE